LFKAIDQDDVALAGDVLTLFRFMLATGQRIGECLAVLWFEVDLQAGRVDVSSTGHGLVRMSNKSKAGERSLLIPSWMVSEL
jgi:integrase